MQVHGALQFLQCYVNEFRRVGLILNYHGNHERFLFALFVGKGTVPHFIPGLWNNFVLCISLTLYIFLFYLLSELLVFRKFLKLGNVENKGIISRKKYISQYVFETKSARLLIF